MYGEYCIRTAVSKCGVYGKKLSQEEYYALLEYAPIGGEIGRPARQALLAAKALRERYLGDRNADNFGDIYYRDRNKELTYAMRF